MKILRLSFKNIHSLKGENSIDFTKEPLSLTGIFAIIGPTGSGKSTLLDVITLALYNRTPRIGVLSKTSVKNYGSVITRNTENCYAEIEYEINCKKYRSKWEISTARTGELRDYSMELAEIPSGKILSDKKGDVPDQNSKIIGLNYDQFVKSIVLSQGDFAKFLKASPDERGDLLEKITGTDIYRKIGKAAFEKQKEEKTKLDMLNARIQAINLLSVEEIEELATKQSDYLVSVKNLNENLQKISKLFTTKETLQNLYRKKIEIENQLTFVENQLSQFDVQIQKLQKHDKLINLKSEISELKNSYTSKNELSAKISESKNQIILIDSDIQKTENLLNDLNKGKSELEKEVEIVLPKLKKARELDLIINNNETKKNEILNVFQKKSQDYKIDFAKIDELAKLINKEKLELKNDEFWLTENALLEELKVNFNLIKEKTLDFKAEIENLNSIVRSLKIKDLSSLLVKSESLFDKLSEVKKFISNIENEETEIKSKIDFKNENKLQLDEKLDNLRAFHDVLKNQMQLAENYNKSKIRFTEISNVNSQLQTSISELELKIKTLKSENEICEKYIEELKIRKERQQLEAKYSDDRKKLILGEECFLCGSKEHPFIKNYDNQLDNTSRLLKQKEDEFKKNLNNISFLEKTFSENSTLLNSNNQIVAQLNDDLIKISENFSELNLKSEFKQKIENQDGISKSIQNVIEQGKIVKNKIELFSKYAELQNDKLVSENILDKIENVFNKQKLVKEYFTKYKKYTNETNDFNSVILSFEREIKKLSNVNENIVKLNKSINSSENLLIEKNNSIEKLKIEILEQKSELDNIKYIIENTKNQRFDLIGDENSDKLEEKYNKSLKDFGEKINSEKNNQVKHQTEKHNTENNLKTLTQDFEKVTQKINSIEEILLPKLKNEGFVEIETALNSILTDNEVEEIRKNLTSLRDNKTSVIQSQKDLFNEIEKHKTEDNENLNFDEVKSDIEKYKSQIESQNREIGIIRNKIDENNIRANETKILKTEILSQEKEFLRWNDLNELIGDALGKRFTLFAQQVTLNNLIGLANRHLKKLNDRYLLKKSEQNLRDNLYVIDLYMANSERSVQTLSGGESFLVSLALALALSDLASRNTKIECLFIDEGFGTLDNQTLDVALTTLEDLQSQTNRTIGIISHVQAIKDRISTQIELKKLNSGYSSIEIR